MKPLVTIVTVTYNAGICLEQTILSVVNQKNIDFEYILIDGGSNDNTLEIINKYDKQINFWESNPDKGIYDAMNKSLKYVNGSWIIFMNAGDRFFNDNVLSETFTLPNLNNYNIIYGNHCYEKKNNLIIKPPKPLTSIWKYMPICHQSIFAKSEVLKNNPFNLNYKLAADYNFILNTYKINKDAFLYVDKTISNITTGGFSETNSIETYKEYKKISTNFHKNQLIKLYFFFKICERIIISRFKKYYNI